MASVAACLLVSATPIAVGQRTREHAAHPSDRSARLFDPSFVHEVAFEVASRDLDVLGAGTAERVPATVTVDGMRVELAGLRLKRGQLSFQGLDEKAGFSVKLDEYVKGQGVLGVEHFTVGNEVFDASFVSEHLTYEVFRRAGIPAPRTALANVTLNGELFGLYVLREAYDRRFLERNFADPDGNLYEAPYRVDLADSRLELRTNERRNDKRDIEALRRVVESAPDAEYTAALGKLVDLPELFAYWATEALTGQLDGYLAVTDLFSDATNWSCTTGNSPNNYYAYRDPARGKFVILPWGADLSIGNWEFVVFVFAADPSFLDADHFGGALAPALCPPKSGASTVHRLAGLPGTEERLRNAILSVLDRAWDVPALLARADQFAELVRANGLGGSREVHTLADFEREFALRRLFIEARPAAVRAELGAVEG